MVFVDLSRNFGEHNAVMTGLRGPRARAGAVDTHLFLNGSAPDDMHENLLNMAARTCFMHAAAAARIEPPKSKAKIWDRA